MIETIVGFVGMSLPLAIFFLHPVTNVEIEYWDRQSKAIKTLSDNGL